MSDALVNGLAGACGGMLAQVLTYPIQAVNTRQQVRRKLLPPTHPSDLDRQSELAGERGICGAGEERTDPETEEDGGATPGTSCPEAVQLQLKKNGSNPAQTDNAKAGVADTAQEMWQILQAEGLGGLYRGLESSLVGTACSQGVYYYFYQLFRDQAQKLALQRKAQGQGSGAVGMAESLVVAALAGCVNVLLTNPIWVIVTRMQTQSSAGLAITIQAEKDKSGERSSGVLGGPGDPGELRSPSGRRIVRTATAPPKKHLGAFGTTWELFQEAGILGFWKGVLPTLIMVSNPAIQYAIYETLLQRVTAKRPKSRGGVTSASAWEVFLLGAIAKLSATVCTYPLLVVKSRLQARASDSSAKYSGTLDALVRIIMEEGVTGLYKGMETKILQSVFAASVLFLTKEEIVKMVRVLVDRRQQLLQLKGATTLAAAAAAADVKK